jgi:hypothetical protein
MDGDQACSAPARQLRCPADEVLTFRGTGQRGDHGSTDGNGRRFLGVSAAAGCGSLMLQPAGRKIPERGEVARGEVAAQRDVGLFVAVHRTARQTVTELLGTHVDDLERVGCEHDRIGHRFAGRDSCQSGHGPREGVDVLDVQVRDDIDSGGEQLLDVLPPLFVPSTGDVRVRELVDQGDVGLSSQNAVEVQVLEGRAPIDRRPRWDALEAQEVCRRVVAIVVLHPAGHDVVAVLGEVPSPGEHRVRLPHAGRSAEVDVQTTSSLARDLAGGVASLAHARAPRLTYLVGEHTRRRIESAGRECLRRKHATSPELATS